MHRPDHDVVTAAQRRGDRRRGAHDGEGGIAGLEGCEHGRSGLHQHQLDVEPLVGKQAALRGEEYVERWIAEFELELRTAVFLAGVAGAAELRRASVVVTGPSRQWLDQLGYRRGAPRARK